MWRNVSTDICDCFQSHERLGMRLALTNVASWFYQGVDSQSAWSRRSQIPLEGYIVKNMRRNVQQGFTLIELMIVIAIVAILVALAVPAYQDYTIRAKVAECVNNAAVAKLAISEYYETVGVYPPSSDEAGTTAPAGASQYCDGFTYVPASGAFFVLVDETAVQPGIAQVEPQLLPNAGVNTNVDWTCLRGNTNQASWKYLPSTCRSS